MCSFSLENLRSPLSRTTDDAYVKGHLSAELIERGLEEGQRRMQWILNKVDGRGRDVLPEFDLQCFTSFQFLGPKKAQ